MWGASQQANVSPQFPATTLSCTGTRFKGNPQCTFPIISSRSGALFAQNGSSFATQAAALGCFEQASQGSVWGSRTTLLQPSKQWSRERQPARALPQDWQSPGDGRAQLGFPPSFQAPYLLTVVKDSREGFSDCFSPIARETAGPELEPYPLIRAKHGEEEKMLLSASPSLQSWNHSGPTPHAATYRNRYHANPPPMRYEAECPRHGVSDAARHSAEIMQEEGLEHSPGSGFFSCDASPWAIMECRSHTTTNSRTNDSRKVHRGCLSSFRDWSRSARRRAEKCPTISSESAGETAGGFGFSQCWLCNTVTWGTENGSDYFGRRTEGEAAVLDMIASPPSH